MKKIIIMTLLSIAFISSAFAAGGGIGVDTVGTMALGSGSQTPDNSTTIKVLSMGLSSNVHGYYNTDGSQAEPSQWYVIGTYHLGGNNVYATAQDITNLYKLTDNDAKTPGETFSWTGLPEDSSASNVWSTDVWTKL